MFNEPEYVLWMLGKKPIEGPLVVLHHEVREAIKRFDAMPFVLPCRTAGCKRPATCCSKYIVVETQKPMAWCEVCNPFGPGDHTTGNLGNFRAVRSYMDAILGDKDQRDRLLKHLAQAKGLSSSSPWGKAPSSLYPWS